MIETDLLDQMRRLEDSVLTTGTTDSADIIFDDEAAAELGIQRRSVQVAIARKALKGRIRPMNTRRMPTIYVTTRSDLETYKLRRGMRGRGHSAY